MDFSQAERLGFILAFGEFWRSQIGNQRSDDELVSAAEHLLRGCAEHFRANVTRISKISAVVGIGRADHFKGRALALLDAVDNEGFQTRAALLIDEYPLIGPWINWWLLDSHASMVFPLQQKMDAKTWNSIPATTNAEEAMHHVFYSGAGRDHDLMEGFSALFSLSEFFVNQYERLKGNFFC